MAITAVTAWVLVTLAKLGLDAHYYDGYDPAAPLNVEIRADEPRTGYRRVYFAFEGCAGYPAQPVPALLALPLEGDGPFPVLVFLHGIGQNMTFLDEIGERFAVEGFALATFDQYMQGERKLEDPGLAEQGLALVRRGAMTVNEARRLVDYLETRPEIDANRIYLIGASYGAMTGAAAAAFDERFRAVVLTYGGGDLRKLAGSEEVRNALGPLSEVVGQVAAWVAAPFDPVRHVHRISPRPILFQNGEKDRIVVPAAAQALYDAAREPKEMKWYPSDHLDLDPEFIAVAIRDAIEWIRVQDARIVAAKAQG